MLIGVPKEIKNHEYRVGLTPDSVREFIAHGHKVIVETNAGAGIGCLDEAYKAAGADIVDTAADVFGDANMVVKVKEPQPSERKMLREDQILFTYLHLAPDAEQPTTWSTAARSAWPTKPSPMLMALSPCSRL